MRILVILLALAGVPLLLMLAAASAAWQGVWREARFDMTRTADAGAEYALRVLSGYAVAAGRVDAILRGLTDAEIRAGEQALHQEIRGLVAELPQAEAAYVVDRDGRALVGASVFPVPRDQAPAADRDFFIALREPGFPPAHVSQVYRSRFDGTLFFAVSRRRTRTGNLEVGPNGFDGLVNLSLYPNRIAEGLARLASDPEDTLSLLRADGELLARSTGLDGPARVAAGRLLEGVIADGRDRAVFETASAVDGQPRLYALRRVEGWPVYVVAGRPRATILAEWRRAVGRQLLVAVPASGVLLGLAVMVLRAQARLANANAQLEQRVAERTAALAASEAHLSDALQVGRVFTFEWDARTDALRRSSSAAAILGLSAKRAERDTGARFATGIHQDDARRVRETLRGLAPHAPGCTLRLRYRRPDGGLVWLQHEAASSFGPDGTLRRVTGLARDVTAEAEAEMALRTSEARMRELLATLDLGAAIVRDPDGTIRFWSLGCERLYGWSAAEALGRVAHQLLGTTFPEPLADIESRLEREGSWSGDLMQHTRDGHVVAVTTRMVMRRTAAGLPDAVLEMLADVTAQRAAEALLSEREAEFRAMFEGSIVGMVQAEPVTCRLLRVNRRFAEMAGASETALTAGRTLFDLIHPEDRPAQRAAFAAAMAETGRLDTETRLLHGDREPIWTMAHLALVRGQGGAPARIVAVLQDITERRRAEEQRELMTRELDHRAKNALAVVQAALRLTPKADAESYARAIEGRVAALARAHTLLAHGRWEGAMLRAVLEAEMATFLLADLRDAGLASPRVTAEGPDLMLQPAAVQAISMALHELATNATKYGALSAPGGSVAVRWEEDRAKGLLRLLWVERGGPAVVAPPPRRGFGSRVIEATLRDQLGGNVSRQWQPEGLVCTIELPLGRVVATRLAAA